MGAVANEQGEFTHRKVSASAAPPVETTAANSVFSLQGGAAPRGRGARASGACAMQTPAAGSFRCGLFNSGELVIEHEGQSMRLPRECVRELVSYLDKVASGAVELP